MVRRGDGHALERCEGSEDGHAFCPAQDGGFNPTVNAHAKMPARCMHSCWYALLLRESGHCKLRS
jgi:hypothetical protein